MRARAADQEEVRRFGPLARETLPRLTQELSFHQPPFSNIARLKMEQSDLLLMPLLHAIESCMDPHVRVRWDNHRLVYTTFDRDSDDIHKFFRVTMQVERPVAKEAEYHQWSPELVQELPAE